MRYDVPYVRTALASTRKWLNKGYVYVKVKGKVIPLQARCDPESGYRYSSTLP